MPKTATKPNKYKTISLPNTLIDRVDDVVNSEQYGYQNRVDFVLEAVRKRLRELGKLE